MRCPGEADCGSGRANGCSIPVAGTSLPRSSSLWYCAPGCRAGRSPSWRTSSCAASAPWRASRRQARRSCAAFPGWARPRLPRFAPPSSSARGSPGPAGARAEAGLSEQVFSHFGGRLRRCRQELFFALLLDSRHRLIGEVEVSRGSLNQSLVHPREVFAPALREAAAAILVLHNHPSGGSAAQPGGPRGNAPLGSGRRAAGHPAPRPRRDRSGGLRQLRAQRLARWLKRLRMGADPTRWSFLFAWRRACQRTGLSADSQSVSR